MLTLPDFWSRVVKTPVVVSHIGTFQIHGRNIFSERPF